MIMILVLPDNIPNFQTRKKYIGNEDPGSGANLRFDDDGLYKRLQHCTAIPLHRVYLIIVLQAVR